MNSYIGVTDKPWFSLLRSQQGIEEGTFDRHQEFVLTKRLIPGRLKEG
ncbi:MAG: hypothetical protein AAGU75_05350 [Bacillota bacterium]